MRARPSRSRYASSMPPVPQSAYATKIPTSDPYRSRTLSTLAATASAISCGRMCRRASTPSTRMPGIPGVIARSSRASAPHPTMTRRVGTSVGTCVGTRSGRTGAALVDEPARGLRGHSGITTVGIGPDRRPELLVERRATDEHDVVIADAAVAQCLDHDLHVWHGRRQERRHPEDVRLVLLERGDELVGVRVDSEVEHLETGALEHHPDQVLADVVDVALDGPDDDLADRLGTRLGEERAEDGHAGLHRVGGKEDLGDEQDAVAEVDADDLHPRDESVVEDLGGSPAAAQQDVGALDDLGGHAVVEVVVDLLGELIVGERREIDLRVLVLRHVPLS